MSENKISVQEYVKDNGLLEVSYIPYDDKMSIVSHVLNGVIKSVGGLNTSLLRRIATEVFIESISNINLSIEDINGFKGFDQLCYLGEMNKLKAQLGDEYQELQTMLDERVQDYIRTETNPAVTIEAIYNQLTEYAKIAMDYISGQVQNIDTDKVASVITKYITANGGEKFEGK